MTATTTVPVYVTLAELADLLGISRTRAKSIAFHTGVRSVRLDGRLMYDRDAILAALAAQAGAR